MPLPPRYAEPDSIQFVTFRTAASLLLLRPSPAINELILGVLGRALALYPIQLFAYVFLSNHAHLLLRTPDADVLARFLAHVEGNIARGVQRILGWRQRVWTGRASYAAVIDDEATIDRLRYILAHGAKERLVASPLDWPGVTCARALAGLETPKGRWVNRTAAYEDRRRVRPRGEAAYTTEYAIELAQLPCWANLEPTAYHARCRATIDELAEAAAAGAAPSLGVEGVLAQDPRTAPRETKHQQRPKVFATCPLLRKAYLLRHDAYCDWHRDAAAAQRAGIDMPFPPGSFASSRVFVPYPVIARSTATRQYLSARQQLAAPHEPRRRRRQRARRVAIDRSG